MTGENAEAADPAPPVALSKKSTPSVGLSLVKSTYCWCGRRRSPPAGVLNGTIFAYSGPTLRLPIVIAIVAEALAIPTLAYLALVEARQLHRAPAPCDSGRGAELGSPS